MTQYTVRKDRMYSHLYKIHNIKGDLTTCNVCRKLASELNLIHPRKTLHPERFKSDRSTCSGCNLVLRAVDYDSYECAVDADDVWAAESKDHLKGVIDTLAGKDVGENMDSESGKLLIELKKQKGLIEKVVYSSISCPEREVVFADDDIKHHDCKRKAFVMMKRIKLAHLNPEAGSRNLRGPIH